MPSGHFLTNQTPPSLPPHIDRRQIASAFDRTYQQVSTLPSSYATTPLDNLDNLDNTYIFRIDPAHPRGRLQQGRPAEELRGVVGGARTQASCNVVGGRAWVPLMDAEALSVCGEELGELRHYGAGLRGTAVAPTGCMLLRL